MARALAEKQRIIADILHIPDDDFDHIADIASERSQGDPNSHRGDEIAVGGEDAGERDAREVLLAALAQGT